MNIVKATRKFESWMRTQTAIVEPDLKLKHRKMAESEFEFFRATFYRWIQIWPEICADLQAPPRVLAVGDLHVENFGTWRDTDGRLVWGINDFDEVNFFPYAIDLVRLATSVLLARRENHLAVSSKDAAEAILRGYAASMKDGGRPFVLSEEHAWLRQIAESELRDPLQFWQKMDALPTVQSEIPASARDAIEHLLPERGLPYRLARRVAGLGSLGHMRFVGVAHWNGGRIAREAKALTPSSTYCWKSDQGLRDILYAMVLRKAIRCPDPYVHVHGPWIVRRLSPHCSRIELQDLAKTRDELKLLAAMGWETANIHLATPEQRKQIRKDLQSRKGTWLERAAQAMAKAVRRDWQNWREVSKVRS